VIPLFDGLEASARAIDSVNTIVNDDGILTGYNTDYVAVRALVEQRMARPMLLCPARQRHGQGGGRRLARCGLHAGPSLRAIRPVARRWPGPWLPGRQSCPKRGAIARQRDPAGMEGPQADELAFLQEQIEAATMAFDVVAQPAQTLFIAAAQAAGKPVISAPK
jgi:shikimate dehydrogenase